MFKTILMSLEILDCAVIGIYDENRVTELPRTYIVPGKNMSHPTKLLKPLCNLSQIESYITSESSTGKILRKELRDAAKLDEAFTTYFSRVYARKVYGFIKVKILVHVK
ncbi:hypothetical protein EDC94DRAFT_583513 [Helicostylum pulchrum]|nr:hypothetical protein EDC94DRAFT_583513 [Helicostylum pulchrum]